MKNKMEEMEKKIKEQSENLLKYSEIVNQKESQLNIDISKYLKEISNLKNEMELLNGTISNLTEEKENNNNKISQLIKENEELKKIKFIKN
jgi:chromosome segregation ATPase